MNEDMVVSELPVVSQNVCSTAKNKVGSLRSSC